MSAPNPPLFHWRALFLRAWPLARRPAARCGAARGGAFSPAHRLPHVIGRTSKTALIAHSYAPFCAIPTFAVKLPYFLPSRIRFAFVLLALCAGLAGGARAEAVGLITLRLGEAWILDGEGRRRPAETQAEVGIGERIETGAGGHVHVRFVDGGLVSVRPESRLWIQDYRPAGAGGAAGIRFKLERGTVRSSTGRWGEAERDRYRLNTPIAGIGIQGTDYLVQASSEATRVAVFSGAVIVAPFGPGCDMAALGPCEGETARRLTEEMMGWMIEVRPGREAAELVPWHDLPLARVETAALAPPVRVASAEVEVAREAVAHDALQAQPAPLVWARWGSAAPAGPLVQPREQAAQGRERVAEDARYILYRLPQSAVLPEAGVASLRLAASEARLHTLRGTESAEALGGRLRIDFGLRRFDTALDLQSRPTGPVRMEASGRLGADGTFSLIDFYTRVRGAVAESGTGVVGAYAFEHATPAGMFSGITLWR